MESNHKDKSRPNKAVPVNAGRTDIESHRNLALVAKSPEFAAYRVVAAAEHKSGIGELLDTPAILAELREQADRVKGGSLAEQEAMLTNMATALQSLFSRLAERAMGCESVMPFEANMRMALRAQSQCRATIETLAMIKNPPIVYARQANIANGPQQVNNGLAQVRETENLPSKLLEHEHGERLDLGAPGTAGAPDQELETVGAINRTAHARG